MAEFEFILSENEQSEVLEFIEKTGGGFVPCIGYNDPSIKVIERGLKAVKMWKRANLIGPVGPIFIVWENIAKYPLQFDKIEKSQKIFYYPAQGEGGPYMDYSPSELEFRNGKPYLSNGFVGYYQKYWLAESEQEIKAPPELKDKYKHITKFIRSISSRVVVEKRVYWIGYEAAGIIRDGATTNVGDLIVSAK